MNIRIVSGILGGRRLRISDSGPGFRPTAERTRQAVADSLTPRIEGARVADVCAGTGAFGFELISRGASSVLFVEKDRRRLERIREHAKMLGIAAVCRFLGEDARTFVRRCCDRFDLIYYDPPYADEGLRAIAFHLPALLDEGGLLLYERDSRGESTPLLPPWRRLEERRFGQSCVEYIDIEGERKES